MSAGVRHTTAIRTGPSNPASAHHLSHPIQATTAGRALNCARDSRERHRPTRWLVALSVLFALVLLHVVSDHGTSVLGHHDSDAASTAASADGGDQVEVAVKTPLVPPHPAEGHTSCELSVARSSALTPASELTEVAMPNRSLPLPARGFRGVVRLDRFGWATAAGLCVIRV